MRIRMFRNSFRSFLFISLNCLTVSIGYAQEIKIGALFSLTGYAAIAGKDELDGVILAVEEKNLQGGISGKRIVLISEDNRSDQRATTTGLQKLIGIDNVAAIIGPNWTEFTEIAAPIAQRNKVLLLTPSGWSKNLIKDRDYVFSSLENHLSIVKPLTELIIKKQPKKITAFVAANQYFESLFENISDEIGSKSMAISKVVKVNPSDTEFRTSLLQINATSDDVILNFLAEGVGLSAFYRQIREMKIPAQIYSANSIRYDNAFLSNLSAAEGTIFFDYVDPSTEDFKLRFEERFKRKPIPGAARAYDAMNAILQAAKECGTSSEDIKRCLPTISFKGASGAFGFDADRNFTVTAAPSRLYIVKDGSIQPF